MVQDCCARPLVRARQTDGLLRRSVPGKVLIWDKVLSLGVTDGLCRAGDNCWTGTVSNTIVMFYFGKRGFENVASAIASIKRSR
jgi:hypothetical protein